MSVLSGNRVITNSEVMANTQNDEIDWSKMLEEDWQILMKEMRGDELNEESNAACLNLTSDEGDLPKNNPEKDENKLELKLRSLNDSLEEAVRQVDRQKVLMQRQKQYTERLERWTHQMQGMVCEMESRITALEQGNGWLKGPENFEDLWTGTLGNVSEEPRSQLDILTEYSKSL